MVLSSGSSSDDDDVYLSAASRLKALKKKPIILNDESRTISENKESDFMSPITSDPVTEIIDVDSDSTVSQNTRNSTRQTRYRARAKNKKSPKQQVTSAPVVVLDDEDDEIIWETPKDSLNESQFSIDNIDEDDYSVDVKVRWKSREIVRLELKKNEPFEKIFQYFANLEGVSERQILILRDNRNVDRIDTPASLDLKVIDILEGGIVTAGMVCEEDDAEEVCKIKVQMSTKQKINVDLKMTETFNRVLTICAEQLNVDPSKIKLSFDGDDITSSDTPESLDLEQEACIDLRITG